MTRELSVFVDESGDLGGESKYYLLSLVFHDQETDLAPSISLYETDLRHRNLSDVPFHFAPLTRANDAYRQMDVPTRQALLSSFSTFVHHTTFSYGTFCYRKSWFTGAEALGDAIRRDLIDYLRKRLEFFQGFDAVKIYYDDGQHFVTSLLHESFEEALGRAAVVYRDASPERYRLLQVADFACGIELAAIRYEEHRENATDALFFGKWRDFKKNQLKRLRKHLL